MRAILVAMVTLAALPAVAADGWTRLTGAELTVALAGRGLGYADGTRQTFRADGGTTFWSTAGAQSQGRWGARGDRYCSVWPPSDVWACYDVDESADHASLRFIDDAGGVSEGRFAAE